MIRAVLDGIVRYEYSDGDDCICCPGRHVFARRLEGVDVPGWLSEELRKCPDGTRIRIQITEPES